MKAPLSAGYSLLMSPLSEGRLSLDQIVDRFRFLSVSLFYDQFSAIVDLVIYILVFVGAAQVTLGRRYPGRGGQAMVIGIGLTLAISMVLAEERFGFSIRSFGPMAAGILALLFAIMVYGALRWASLGRIRSASIAYAVLALALLVVAPSLFAWFQGKGIPAKEVAVALSLLAVLGILASGHGVRPDQVVRGREPRQPLGSEPIFRRARAANLWAKDLLRRFLKPGARRIKKETQTVRNDLNSIKDVVRRYGRDPMMRPQIIEKIRAVAPEGLRIRDDIQRLRDLNGRLENLDARLLSDESRVVLKSLDNKSRQQLKIQMKEETRRMDVDGKTRQVEESAKREVENMVRYLAAAAQALQEGRVRDCMASIEKALESERALMELARILKSLENYLLSLTKAELRIR